MERKIRVVNPDKGEFVSEKSTVRMGGDVPLDVPGKSGRGKSRGE